MNVQRNPGRWHRRGETVGRAIGGVIVAVRRGRFGGAAKAVFDLVLDVASALLLASYRRSERVHQRLIRPRGEPNRWLSAIGASIVRRFAPPAPPVALDPALFTIISDPSQVVHLQLALERSLVTVARSEGLHTLQWTEPRQRWAMFARISALVMFPVILATYAASRFVPATWFAAVLMTVAALLTTVTASILLVAGVILLVLRHDRLTRLRNERYPYAVALAGGVGALPAWSVLIAEQPVLLHLLVDADSSPPQSLGDAIGYWQWLVDTEITAETLDTMTKLAGEYQGTLAELAETAKALQ